MSRLRWMIPVCALLGAACKQQSADAVVQPPAVRAAQLRVTELDPIDAPLPDARTSIDIAGLDSGGPRYGDCVVQYAMGITTGFDALLGPLELDGESSLYAARVPHGDAGDRASWRFARGDDRWSTRAADARPLFAGFDGRVTVFWCKPLMQFVALYGRIDRAGYALVARAAREPVGPYGPPRVLTRVSWSAASIPSDVQVHADEGIVDGVMGDRVRVSVFDPTIGKRRVFRVTW